MELVGRRTVLAPMPGNAAGLKQNPLMLLLLMLVEAVVGEVEVESLLLPWKTWISVESRRKVARAKSRRNMKWDIVCITNLLTGHFI